jgi:hypothetical protein
MRGPSKRAWRDTNMQYTAPMTVITFRSDERNIWKIKQSRLHTLLFHVLGLFQVSIAQQFSFLLVCLEGVV